MIYTVRIDNKPEEEWTQEQLEKWVEDHPEYYPMSISFGSLQLPPEDNMILVGNHKKWKSNDEVCPS